MLLARTVADQTGCEDNASRGQTALEPVVRLLRLLSNLTGCPTVSVTVFRGDNACDLAAVGMECRTVPLKASPIAHAARLGGAISENFHEDPRFRHLASLPSCRALRFFASSTVVDKHGQLLGMVTIEDCVNHYFDEQQKLSLCDVAALMAAPLATLDGASHDALQPATLPCPDSIREHAAAILDFSRLLQGELYLTLTDRQREYLRLMMESGGRIIHIMDK